MDKKRIIFVTDMSFQGSGYFNIAVPILSRLGQEYQVIVIGFGYEGQEHWWPFTIIPCKDLNDIYAMMHNLVSMPNTNPDAIVVALDIPQQLTMHGRFSQYKKPYIAITPLENPPLRMSWTAQLMQMNFVFFISELGKQTAIRSGMKNADHLEIGIDTDLWRMPTSEERVNIRNAMGYEDDELVILTVAENQERKNLWAAQSIVSELKRKDMKVKYVMVTRVDTPYGWDLRDLARSLGINSETTIINKGMPQKDLWGLYASADIFLLTSKAEGLGLPVLEAMACGTPVVATDTGAIHELLEEGRGILVSPEYSFVDVWGNSKRDMISIHNAKELIYTFFSKDRDLAKIMAANARKFVESKTWDIPAKQLKDKIEELTNVEKTQE